MKNFDLNACGVQELEMNEMVKANGGEILLLLAGIAIAVAGGVAFMYAEEWGDKLYHWIKG